MKGIPGGPEGDERPTAEGTIPTFDLRFAGGLGITGAEGDDVPQTDVDLRARAAERLTTLVRGVYEEMQTTGDLEHLSSGDQKRLERLAGVEEPVARACVGTEVDGLRKKAGLTQAGLASGLEVSLSTMTRFLQGSTGANTQRVVFTLREISKALVEQDEAPLDPAMVKRLLLDYQKERYVRRYKRGPGDEELRRFDSHAEQLSALFFTK